jgi:hypothetical protein
VNQFEKRQIRPTNDRLIRSNDCCCLNLRFLHRCRLKGGLRRHWRPKLRRLFEGAQETHSGPEVSRTKRKDNKSSIVGDIGACRLCRGSSSSRPKQSSRPRLPFLVLQPLSQAQAQALPRCRLVCRLCSVSLASCVLCNAFTGDV